MIGYGILADLTGLTSTLTLLAGLIGCAYFGLFPSGMLVFTLLFAWGMGASMPVIAILAGVAILLGVPPIRTLLISKPIMAFMNKIGLMPVISETERTALEAGTIWLDGELFSGKPNFSKLLNEPYFKLTDREQKFLDTQVKYVCDLVNDDQAYRDGDLSQEVWAYLKKEKFLGMVIPEEYGGLGFSAAAHSEVIATLGTVSIPLVITTMVPNSLGPAELLLHYGTKEQKDYYLPRLAIGEEIPCFGLTEPTAGSDAGAIQSTGVVFKGDDGKLYLKLNWEKRYITLGAVSTLIGLAVQVVDPDNLLGRGEKPGITCVMVPRDTAGVEVGHRHDPLGVPFINSPIFGRDVVVSVDQVIGGVEGVGQGWKMLMESLAAGRSISIPSQSAGTIKKLTRISSAYSSVRRQFGIPVSSFEGVGEVLGQMGALTYLVDAARKYTVSAVDQNMKPAVLSAIMKYHSTELCRKVAIDAMDVVGGAGISLGPKNLIAKSYIAAPIAITVEGANILTRTMIIFGQGAIRCHPYAYKELLALGEGNAQAFDSAFFAHIGHVLRNGARALVLSLTGGHLAATPSGPLSEHYRRIARVSASFAFFADVAMGTLGGRLKFKEKLTGRFSDVLSWMYLITAACRRWEHEGRREEDLVFVHAAAEYGFAEIDKAFAAIFANFPVAGLGWLLKYPVAFWARLRPLGRPSDEMSERIVKILVSQQAGRDNLTQGIHFPANEKSAMMVLEKAFKVGNQASLIVRKVHKAVRAKQLEKQKGFGLYKQAFDKGVINQSEFELLELAVKLEHEVIGVDSYTVKDYVTRNEPSRSPSAGMQKTA